MNVSARPHRRRWTPLMFAALFVIGMQIMACLPALAQPAGPPAARWDSKPDGRAWTQMTLESLGQHGMGLVSMVPSDIGNYCPAYQTADQSKRMAFWVGLISALAKFESSYKPEAKFTEPNIFDAQGNRVVSRGLLQISIESGRGYGCVIPTAEALHEPVVNLACTVRIMNRLITRDGLIGSTADPWKGAAAYWSPFRKQARRQDIQNWTKRQAYCR